MGKPEITTRIITPEERIALDPGGHQSISRSGGHEGALLLGKTAVFGEEPATLQAGEDKQEVA